MFYFLMLISYDAIHLIMNKIVFAVGLIIAITSALLVAFVGTEKLGFWPMVSGIVGISLIATSGIRILKR